MSTQRLPWAFALLAGGGLLAFGAAGFPVAGSDAQAFLVSAINHARGRGLVNQVHVEGARLDPTGRQRHIFHAPLFPVVLAALMPEATPRGAFLAVAFLRVLGLLLFVAGAGAALRAMAAVSPATDVLLAASVTGLATHWIPTAGRAEALGTLFVLLAAGAPLVLRGWPLLAAFAACTGLLAATQPTGAVMLLALVAVYLAAAARPPRALLSLTAVAAGALAIFALILSLTPHGLRDSLQGLALSAPQTPWADPAGPDWWRPWLTGRQSTFHGPFVALVLVLAVNLAVRHRAVVAWPAGAALAALAFGTLFAATSFSFGSRRLYNGLLFAPLGHALVAVWLGTSRGGGRRQALGRGLSFAAVLLTGVGFAGHLLALPIHLRQGVTLARARGAWEAVAVPGGQAVAASRALWVLDERYERLTPAPDGLEAQRASAAAVVLVAQRPIHVGRAPDLAGRERRLDLFHGRPASAGASLLAPFLEQDYAFAAYGPAR